MMRFSQALPFVLVLSLVVERGDSFAPTRRGELRYPKISSCVKISSYLDNLTPRDEDKDTSYESSSLNQENLEDTLVSQQEALENHNSGAHADSYLNNLSVSGYQGAQRQQDNNAAYNSPTFSEHSVKADQASSRGSSWAPINPKQRSQDRMATSNTPEASVAPPSAWANTNEFQNDAEQNKNVATPDSFSYNWNQGSSFDNNAANDETVSEPRGFGEAPGVGSFQDNLGQDSSDSNVNNEWTSYVEAPESPYDVRYGSTAQESLGFEASSGISSFANSLVQDSSNGDVENGQMAPESTGFLEAPGTKSYTDSLGRQDSSYAGSWRSGTSVDDVSNSNNGAMAPESTDFASAPEIDSFADTLGQDSSMDNDANNDESEPELSGFAAGLSSFADSLTQSSSIKDSSYTEDDDVQRTESAETTAPAWGTFADSLGRSSSYNDVSCVENDVPFESTGRSETPEMFSVYDSQEDTPSTNYDQIGNEPAQNDDAASTAASPGMMSFADTLNLASATSSVDNDQNDELKPTDHEPAFGISSFADSLKSSQPDDEALNVKKNDKSETEPTSFDAAPEMGVGDASNARNDDSAPTDRVQSSGWGSFADGLKPSTSISDTSNVRGAKAPGMGSFLDQLGSNPKTDSTTSSDQPDYAPQGVKGDVTYVPPTADKDATTWPDEPGATESESFARTSVTSLSTSGANNDNVASKETSPMQTTYPSAGIHTDRQAGSPGATDTSISQKESIVENAEEVPPNADAATAKKESLAEKSDKAVAVAMNAYRNNMVGAKEATESSNEQDMTSSDTKGSVSDNTMEPRSATVSVHKNPRTSPAAASGPPSGHVSMVRKDSGPGKETQQDDGEVEISALVGKDDLTLEERIATSISDARTIGLNKKTYESTRENLRDFKFRTQRRLNLSESEKEKAAEKLASIASRLEAETRAVRERLDSKLAESQMNSDREISRIKDLLAAEINLEVEREKNMVQFMDSLRELIESKKIDIANDEKITREMTEARMKLREGAIADNLDIEVEQRLSVAVIEQELVNVLSECLEDLQGLTEDARSRAARTKATLEGLNRPDTRSSNPYDWTDIEEMELVLEQAAINVAGAEKRIQELSQRIDDALVNRAVVLGEDVPPGLARAAQRAAARSIKKASSSPEFEFGLHTENFVELKNKDGTELAAIFAKSLGSAAFDGSKAAVYGLKAVLDTVTGQPAVDAANQIAYEVKKDSDESRKSSALVESKDNAPLMLVDRVKSTAFILGSVGKAGTTIVKGIGESDSAHVAGEALRDTTKDLFTSLETAAALGTKFYHFAVRGIEETLAGEHGDLPRIPWADGMKRLTSSMPDMHPLDDVKEMVRKQSKKNKRLKP